VFGKITPKDATQFSVSVKVPADAIAGVYPVRVLTKLGVSNARPLTLDPLKDVSEEKSNTKRAGAQKVELNSAVVGTIAAESADFFAVPAVAGRRLTVEVVAKRLGSALDPVIVLADAATGRELPGLYAEDTPGLQQDCRVSYVPKTDGTVLVELRDATYKGGPDFAYRLRVGDFPAVLATFPAAGERGRTVDVRGLGTDAKQALKFDRAPVLFAPGSAWGLPVRISEHPEAIETEPNNSSKEANPLAVPGGITAGFFEKADRDWFRFPAKKGAKLELTARTAELPTATEVLLSVRDAAGKELAKSDAMQATARVEFTPPADGEYFAVCEPLNYQYGPGEVYWLTAKLVQPDFSITATDAVSLSSDGFGVVPITLTRAGFDGVVTLNLDGVPGVTGSVVIPAGQAGAVFLPIRAQAAKPGIAAGVVKGTAEKIVRNSSSSDAARTALGGLSVLPPGWAEFTAVGVLPDSTFTLDLKFEKLNATVTLKRPKGIDDEVKLEWLAPAGIAATVPAIAKGKASAAFTVKPDAKWTGGTVLVRGTAAGRTAVSNGVELKK
jgi:hypothetical protein